MRKTRLSAAVVLGVAAVMTPLAAFAGPASAATSGPSPNTPETVASGINVAHTAGRRGLRHHPGQHAGDRIVHPAGAERRLPGGQSRAGVTNYLSVSQFASTYGQTQANISALTSYLAHFGITTNVYADNVDMSATGTAGEYDQALSVTQKQYDVPAAGGTRRAQRDTGTEQHPLQRPGPVAALPALELRAGHLRAHATTAPTPTTW